MEIYVRSERVFISGMDGFPERPDRGRPAGNIFSGVKSSIRKDVALGMYLDQTLRNGLPLRIRHTFQARGKVPAFRMPQAVKLPRDPIRLIG